MILNKTPPSKKAQHETNASAGLLPARALADGQILTCMPAGDSKNKPHREKKPSFFFQCGRAITWKQDIKHQQPAAPRHNHTTRCSTGTFAAPQRARSQGKTRKKQQSKCFFLFLLRRGCPSLSQGKMMACALLRQGRLLSASARARWDNTTIKKEQ
jgi:hypothetical protein